ncbi:hypothetical protein NDU88_000138 [Pleurodeles waltl]|uniref:Uncharacterized protein n=1 Tax=Pleurodeles waltl TaxID=8319 RepID=A0AAV7TE33_PLEWA|nr:hypothetical protein NDU88_000138 [Pleurodeles waltl]
MSGSWFVEPHHRVLRADIFRFCLNLPVCDAFLYAVLRVRRSGEQIAEIHIPYYFYVNTVLYLTVRITVIRTPYYIIL